MKLIVNENFVKTFTPSLTLFMRNWLDTQQLNIEGWKEDILLLMDNQSKDLAEEMAKIALEKFSNLVR